MILFYFSGTGNSKYISERFGKKMKVDCYSIEEQLDFKTLIEGNKIIGFCYPVYCSRVPRIMREFVASIYSQLKGKKIVIFCTQLIFSGDGARAFTDLFEPNYIKVVYAEHFNMPNNICNVPIIPITNDKRNRKYLAKAEHKLNNVCRNMRVGITKKRGFSKGSKVLGLVQGVFSPTFEKGVLHSVQVDEECTGCGLCVSICPMNNLELVVHQIKQKGKCIACYRCVNQCPSKAITVAFNNKVKKQYKGII